jgi:hypothetical protein
MCLIGSGCAWLFGVSGVFRPRQGNRLSGADCTLFVKQARGARLLGVGDGILDSYS